MVVGISDRGVTCARCGGTYDDHHFWWNGGVLVVPVDNCRPRIVTLPLRRSSEIPRERKILYGIAILMIVVTIIVYVTQK